MCVDIKNLAEELIKSYFISVRVTKEFNTFKIFIIKSEEFDG